MLMRDDTTLLLLGSAAEQLGEREREKGLHLTHASCNRARKKASSPLVSGMTRFPRGLVPKKRGELGAARERFVNEKTCRLLAANAAWADETPGVQGSSPPNSLTLPGAQTHPQRPPDNQRFFSPISFQSS